MAETGGTVTIEAMGVGIRIISTAHPNPTTGGGKGRDGAAVDHGEAALTAGAM